MDRRDDTPSNQQQDHAAASSPWRQPIVWLVIALVAAAVAGGIAMVVIASDAGNGDAVADPVRRTAQVQTADLGPDALSAQRRLSAIVRTDAEQELVEVLPVDGDFDPAASLQLRLLHPIRSSEDMVLLLQPGELGWRADAVVDGSHDWNVQLGPRDATPENQWRLQGRLPKGQQAAHLRPALPGG